MVTETTLENKMFDFDKAKVQTLSLAQLERTHRENDVYGKPLRGIYHFELLNTLINECTNLGYNVEVYDLFAAQNKDRSTPGVVLLPQVEAQYGERALKLTYCAASSLTSESRTLTMRKRQQTSQSLFIRKAFKSDSAIW